MILSKSVILEYGDVTCLFNQEVHRYVKVDMNYKMTDYNILVNYGT